MKKALVLVLFFPLLLDAKKFYDDDPLRKEPTPLRVEDANSRKLNMHYDFFLYTFAEPGERQPKRGKGGKAEFIPAQAVNTLGEVPDNAWFTNRIGSRPVSIEELLRSAGNENAPSMDGKWRIIAAKTEGVTPGFRILDSTGRKYVLKFDPLSNPEMATGADVLGAAFFHALGYNVPENYLVREITPPKSSTRARAVTRVSPALRHPMPTMPARRRPAPPPGWWSVSRC